MSCIWPKGEIPRPRGESANRIQYIRGQDAYKETKLLDNFFLAKTLRLDETKALISMLFIEHPNLRRFKKYPEHFPWALATAAFKFLEIGTPVELPIEYK
jgi:hypothetical protein